MKKVIWNNALYPNHILLDPDDIEEFEGSEVYSWYDGKDWITVYKTNEMIETTVTLSENLIRLDEWNGPGETCEYVDVYRVRELDGAIVQNMYLINEWSQSQRSHDTGRVVSESDLIEYLQSIDRTVDEYLPSIKAL